MGLSYKDKEDLVDTMIYIAEEKDKKIPYDITTYAKLIDINDTEATILINDEQSICSIRNGAIVNVGDVVEVTYKQNNPNEKIVVGKKGTVGTGGTTGGTETTTTLGALINGATEKITPVDADMLPLMDSVSSNVVKKLSWTNIKATLKSYFDGIYAPKTVSMVKIVKTVSQSIPNDTDTVLTFDSEEFDTANMHDNTTNNSRIVPPSNGIYQGTLQVDFDNNSTGARWVEIKKNGTTTLSCTQITAVNGGDSVVQIFGTFTLTSADYIEAIAYHDSGSALYVKPTLGTYMTLIKIG